MDYRKKSDDELKDIAMGMMQGSIFTSLSLKDLADNPEVFRPLRELMKREGDDKIETFCWEYSNKSVGRHGEYPVFDTFNYLEDEDVSRLFYFHKTINIIMAQAAVAIRNLTTENIPDEKDKPQVTVH